MVATSIRWAAGLLLAAVVVALAGVLLVPRVFGLTPYVVTSGSMRPTFEPGAVVLTASVPEAELAVGDIVTFQTADGPTTHRIVEREGGSGGSGAVLLTTQGDANDGRDQEPVDTRNVLGEVRFAVPATGYLLEWVRTPVGAGTLAALLAVVVLTGGRRASTETPAAVEARS